MSPSFTCTLKLQVRPHSYRWLSEAAIEGDPGCNYRNEATFSAATRTDRKRKWLSGFDPSNLTAGATEYFGCIGTATIQRVCCL